MKILSINEFLNNEPINEGVGGGYTVTLEGVEIDPQSALFNKETKMYKSDYGNSPAEYIFFTVKIKPCIIDKWSAYDYYNGFSSDIEDDEKFYFNNNEDKTINGGTSTWYVNKQEFVDLAKTECNLNDIQLAELLKTDPNINEHSIWNKCLVKLFSSYLTSDKINFEFDFGGGYSHQNLDDIISAEVDTLNDNTYDKNIAVLDSNIHDLYFSCIKIDIDAKEIAQDINYYFKNCNIIDNANDYDEEYDNDDQDL